MARAGRHVVDGHRGGPRRVGPRQEVTRWTRDYWADVHPYSASGGYVNFMMGRRHADRLRATYGANYERLMAVKTAYDPTNLFRINQNIEPLRHG